MKAVRNSLTLLAASGVMAGAVQAQDKSALFHQGTGTDFAASITLEMKTEPTLVLGSSTPVSGLFVDLIRPQQTWAMLNPSVLPNPVPRQLRPATSPRPINDPAVHKLDFALIRLSF